MQTFLFTLSRGWKKRVCKQGGWYVVLATLANLMIGQTAYAQSCPVPSVNNIEACEPGIYTFKALVPGHSILGFSWYNSEEQSVRSGVTRETYPGIGEVSTDTYSITITPSTPSFTATYYVDAVCYTIRSRAAVTITYVKPGSSVLTLTSSTSPSSLSYCEGDVITFSLSNPSLPVTSYAWYMKDLNGAEHLVSTESSLTTPVYSSAQLSSVRWEATGRRVCSYQPTASGSWSGALMTVNTKVTPGISITANTGNAVWEGTEVMFQASTVNGGYPPRFQWRINGSDVPGATGQTFTTSALSHLQWVNCVLTSNATCTTSPTAVSGNVLMTVYEELAAGGIGPPSEINFNSSPGVLSGTPATGGNGTYNYQWQSSPDDINWQDVIGATTIDYIPDNLIATTYYRRKVSSFGRSAISNSLRINVYPQLMAGTIDPSLTINYGTGPGTLTAEPATGGNGSYSYQWQNSTDNTNWADISGATALNYDPGILIKTNYYRLIAMSNGVSAISNAIVITVYPQLVAGSISPDSLTVSYNMSPGQITGTEATGGDGSYGYQWQSSSDGNTWTDISGATGVSYIPGNITEPTYYRRSVSSNGLTAISNISVVFVTKLVCVPLAPALSQDQNYIVSYTPRRSFGSTEDLSSKNTCEVMQSVQYFDGLGRLIQTVQTKGSPLADKDIVLPFEYDAFGREAKQYLPYAPGSNNGSYKPDALEPGAGVLSFYNPSGSTAPELPGGIARTPVPFAETRFEPSPLSRVEEQGAPGVDWQIGSGHTIRTGYYTNEAEGVTTGSGRWARQYGVSIDGSGNRTLVDEGSYGKNQLYVTELKDENWKETDGRGGTSQEYKDKEGKIVLKRIWKDDSTPLSTCYVYDDFGNLCYVLPPKAEPDGSLPAAATLNALCYQYHYDERNRLSEKKLPGKDWEYIVYNKLDQVVATQDGEQRQRSEWLVTKYDGLGRVVMTGLWQSSMSPGDLKTQVYDSSYQWDVKDYSKSYGYELRTYPQTLSTVLTVNYYDDYDFPGLPEAYKRTGHSGMIHSLLTASRTAVLGNPEHLLWSVNYYDDRGRVTKNLSQHYKGGTLEEGNYDETDNSYSFTDELITSTRSHKVDGAEQVKIRTRYEYDHMGRRVNTWQQVNTADSVLLAQHVYNEVGQLQEKRLHSADQGTTFLQKQEYAYNERGWLTRINDPAAVTSDKAFGMQLSYNEHSDTQKRQYNGNISSTQWQTRVPPGLGLVQEQQGYDYSYDKLSRLELAAYTTAGKAGHFNESLSYDKGGNILTLGRTGNGSLIDQLSYMYENSNQSNRLQSVTDGSGNDEGQPSGTASYTYDSNGNLRTDSRKGLSIEYNYLNLPKKVTKVSTNETITYLYDAAGRKLRKEVTGGNRDYIGGIEYGSSGNIEFFQTEEGRAANTDSGYSYEYMLKDHLGNTRAVVKQDGSILQTPDYYAFGLELNRNRLTPSPDNRYKYNGKELQTELGLEQYDYGARFYDPVTGRFTTVDPLAEKYMPVSSYGYALNNPVLIVDVDGRDIFIPITKGDFTQKAFNQIQALTSDRLALLTTGQVVRVSDISPSSTDMFKIHTIGNVMPSPLKKEFGTALVGTLLENDYKTTIRDVGGGSELVEKGESEATVWHDANTDNRGIKNEDGSGGVSPQVALGHELIHVKNHVKGKTDNTKATVKDPDSGSVKRMKREELNTRQEENKLRREQLEKNRAQPTPVN